MKSWQENRQATAETQILVAFRELLLEIPFQQIGMKEIANKAGCSRATLYRYFTNRAALISAYAEHEARILFAQMPVAKPKQAAEVTVLAAFNFVLHTVRTTPHLAIWFTSQQGVTVANTVDSSQFANEVVSNFLRKFQHDSSAAELEILGKWATRNIISLLINPPPKAQEQVMLKKYLVPLILGENI